MTPEDEKRVLMSERIGEEEAWFIQRWTCEPPEVGFGYQVLRDEWSADGRTRTIHEIRLQGDTQ